MREILFRGKRTDNGKWICGHLLEQNIPDYHSYIVASFIAEQDNRHTEIIEFAIYEVIPETVEQYTGLTDKNGVKIFEGDIVKHYDAVYEIRYITKYTRFAGRNSGCIFAGIPLGNTEVIGNIYDNPELLETATKPAAKNIAQSGLAPATETLNLWRADND